MDRIKKLLAFLEDAPNDSFVQHALALEYIKLNRDEEARTLFETVLKREPGYIGSYYHLGKLLERAGQWEEAIKTYKDGMLQAKQANDRHAYSELQMACEEIEE